MDYRARAYNMGASDSGRGAEWSLAAPQKASQVLGIPRLDSPPLTDSLRALAEAKWSVPQIALPSSQLSSIFAISNSCAALGESDAWEGDVFVSKKVLESWEAPVVGPERQAWLS